MKHHGALRREHVLCPVTALSFYKAESGRLFVLAGEDTRLTIYDVESSASAPCATLQVFKAQPIHGIFARTDAATADDYGDGIASACGPAVLIWGGASVAALLRADIEALLARREVQAPAEALAPDWIYDGVLASRERRLGAVITAHNEVVPLRFGADGRTVALGRLRSPSRPILYSAKLAWDGEERGLIVGAGTAFGEIVVWKCDLAAGEGGEGGEGGCEITHVFTGHEGSIFGVDISPELTLPGGAKTRLLASCSDDRTVRVWDVTELRKSGGRSDAVAKKFSEARETGFGSGFKDASAPQHQSKPVAMVMSHVSRIWHVRFAIDTPELSEGTGSILYSFGEDATTQRWRLELKDPPYRAYLDQKTIHGTDSADTEDLASLTQLDSYHSHSGKHIWSTAIQTEGVPLVASGGADGMINLIRSPDDVVVQSESDNEKHSPFLSFSASEVLKDLGITTSGTYSTSNSVSDNTDRTQAGPATPVKSNTSKRRKALIDAFNQYAFLSDNQILTTTLSGKILVCSLQGDSLQWSEIEVENAIREDLASWQVVRSIGSGNALVGSISGSVYIYDDTKALRKIAQVGGKVSEIFSLTGLRGGTGSKLSVLVTVLGRPKATIMSFKRGEGDRSLSETYIELDRAFIVTAAAFCKEYLVVGSRYGAILIYAQRSGGEYERIARVEAQSKDAVASITMLPGGGSGAAPYFLTTCRDGKYRIYEISSSDSQVEVILRHEASPPLGPMIEGSFFALAPSGKHELIIFGFRSHYFVVWNETQRQQIATVDCGGAHRAFTWRIDPQQPERLSFVWTKASQAYIYRQHRTTHRPLKAGGHGREIGPVSSCPEYLATGAEDTALRIWKYQDDISNGGKELRCLAVLEKHTAGIRSLKWLGNDYLLSSAGNEELFIWKVKTLKSAYDGLAIVCEAAYPDQTPDGDLRVIDFDVEGVQDADATAGDVRMYITLALSNSTIKTYEYSKENGFKLLSKGKYTGACMTQIRHLRMQKDGLHVLTAATDGHVAIWKTSEPSHTENQPLQDYTLMATARLHQSTLKALDLRQMPSESSWFVVTGGDDNAMGTFHVSWDTQKEAFSISNRSIVNSTHAAAITGVSIAAISDTSALVVTTSNDQRIKSWEVQISKGGRKAIALLQNRYSSVADAEDIELMSNGQLVIVGVGMEFWEVG